MNQLILAKIFNVAFIVFFSYFILLIFYYLFTGLLGLFESAKRAWERDEEDYLLSYFSTFAIPVTIIVPARNEQLWIGDCVKSVVNLNYPKFELIVVDDGSTDNTFKILNEVLDLEVVDAVYVKHYKDGQGHRIFKSKKYPNVTVISKDGGEKKAGAVNAGLNIAKHDYVCVVDGDTIMEQDSILKVMAEVQRSPEETVGVGSYFGLANGFEVKNGVIVNKKFSYRPVIAYQNLEYVRSFFGSRLTWSAFNAMPIIAGGFGIWRRDVLYELGGYSSEFTCEDLEFTFRVHKYLADKKKKYRIVMLPYYVCWTDGPPNVRSLIRQRERWQRVEIETIVKYRSMLFNPKYGVLGFLTVPYYIFYEILGIFFEIASLLFFFGGMLIGMLNLNNFLALLVLMIASQITVSLISLISFVRAQRIFPTRYVMYLVLLCCVEIFCYRWILSVAKLSGTIRYFRGIRTYDSYVRQKE